MQYLGATSKNDRMILACFQGKAMTISVIQVCAPTTDANKAEADQFYEDIQHLLELTSKKDVLFIIGDWNAKVGSHEIPEVIRKFGLGVQNKAGQRLTEFCQENALVIANTLFQQHKRRPYTWTSPDGQHRNFRGSCCDFACVYWTVTSPNFKGKLEKEMATHSSVLAWRIPGTGEPGGLPSMGSHRVGHDWSDLVVVVFFAAKDGETLYSQQAQDRELTGSDHEFLIAKFRLKLKKVEKTTRPLRYDLNQIPYDYTVEVINRLKGLDLIECLKNYRQRFITLYRR